ncbi:MAG TPA: TIGR03086 family metal-binding protein [Marmoricola sp.]|nr:TIGR03086 family metal-binding protein [Marmoricola sp.]
MITTRTREAVRNLSHALDQFGDLLEHVHPDDLGRPTPCDGWTVAELVGHVTGGVRRFTAVAHGEQADWTAAPEPVTQAWCSDFRNAADDLLHAWHEAGEEAPAPTIDWQVAELAVHSWDLARATGQSTLALDEGVAGLGLEFLRRGLTEDNRDGAFGPAIAMSPGAPVQDRLAAFAGRDPAV